MGKVNVPYEPAVQSTSAITSPVFNTSFSETCEFCCELSDYSTSRFGKVYHSLLDSRIVAKKSGLVALPTMGQLFVGSLLILPQNHFETMAQVYKSLGKSLLDFLAEMEKLSLINGKTIIFEHAAQCSTNGGCGIYHAHMHVVPVPGLFTGRDALPDDALHLSSIYEAFEYLQDAQEYLLLKDTEGDVVFMDLSDQPAKFPSQYFRRLLVKHFELNLPWNWREYHDKEPAVLESIKLYRNTSNN